MDSQTNRRALLGAAALAPLAIGTATAALPEVRADRAAWDRAVANYLHHRAISDALVGDGERLADGTYECDRLVDNYCEAMDDLIDDVRAPDLQALLYKLDLAQERAGGFCGGGLPLHWKGIRADIVRFAARGLA